MILDMISCPARFGTEILTSSGSEASSFKRRLLRRPVVFVRFKSLQ